MSHWRVEIKGRGRGAPRLFHWNGEADCQDEARARAMGSMSFAWRAMAVTAGIDPAEPAAFSDARATVSPTLGGDAERWLIGKSLIAAAKPTPEALARFDGEDPGAARAALHGLTAADWRSFAAIGAGEMLEPTYAVSWPTATYASASLTHVAYDRSGAARPVVPRTPAAVARAGLAILACERLKPRGINGALSYAFHQRAPTAATLHAGRAAEMRATAPKAAAAAASYLTWVGCAGLAQDLLRELQ